MSEPMKRSWDVCEQAVQRQAPMVLADARRRVWRQPPGYLGPRALSVRLAVSMVANAHMAKITTGRQKDFHLMCGSSACTAVDCFVPNWHLSADIARSLVATDPPGDALVSDLKLPYPGQVFLLPAGFLQDSNGREIDHIVMAASKGGPPPTGGIIISTMWNDHGNEGPPMSLYAPNEASMAEYTEPSDTATYSNEALRFDASEERQLLLAMARLAINATFLINEAPHLVTEPGEIERKRSAMHGGNKVDVLPPRWLGESYRLPRPKGDSQGTHSSPRIHLRRGHWRNQPHGPEMKLRRRQWVQPHVVGAGTEP